MARMSAPPLSRMTHQTMNSKTIIASTSLPRIPPQVLSNTSFRHLLSLPMPALTPKIMQTLTKALTPRAKCCPKRKIKISTLASDLERVDPRSAKLPAAALPLHQPSQVLMRAKVVITNLQTLILDQAATAVWKTRVIQITKKWRSLCSNCWRSSLKTRRRKRSRQLLPCLPPFCPQWWIRTKGQVRSLLQ